MDRALFISENDMDALAITRFDGKHKFQSVTDEAVYLSVKGGSVTLGSATTFEVKSNANTTYDIKSGTKFLSAKLAASNFGKPPPVKKPLVGKPAEKRDLEMSPDDFTHGWTIQKAKSKGKKKTKDVKTDGKEPGKESYIIGFRETKDKVVYVITREDDGSVKLCHAGNAFEPAYDDKFLWHME